MRRHTALQRLAAVALLAAGASVMAADYGGSAASTDKLSAARAKLAEKNYPAAIVELKKVNDTASADWNNLMGFALRKSDTANVAEAERHYDAALRIDPKHKSALEYSGELYLMKGDLATAEQRLAALDKACFVTCSEKRDLQRAIERYKANGNKYVAN